MDEQIVAIYTLINDLLQGLGHQEDRQCRMNDSEVLTTAIVAALFFGGRYETSRRFLQQRQYIPAMLSKSRYSRRLHRISRYVVTLIELLGAHWKQLNQESIYVIDTFPIPVCDNWRIRRCRIYQEERYRGKITSKRRFFYGLKLHLMVTAAGQPVEFFLTPGSASDVTHLKSFQFDLPDGSEIYADKIYNDYAMEDLINETHLVSFWPVRKKNSKRPYPPWRTQWIKSHRKIVETTGSTLTRRMPRTIQAVTHAGFELKIALFVLAESFSHLFKVAT
jgi:hypothetical protein